MSDEPFFFNPNDPDSFEKLERHVKDAHNKEQARMMRFEAANLVIQNWVDSMRPEELAMLYLLLSKFSPAAQLAEGETQCIANIQMLLSLEMGAVSRQLRSMGVGTIFDNDKVLDVILGFEQ